MVCGCEEDDSVCYPYSDRKRNVCKHPEGASEEGPGCDTLKRNWSARLLTSRSDNSNNKNEYHPTH